jgi:Tripartite tricarboxylate transporter TctB family
MTVDRVSGVGLALLAALVLEETWRQRLPLGSLANPGPAYFPGALAMLLLVAGVAVAALGGRSPRASSLEWREWRHSVAIFAACAFCALALERLGYRLTVFIALSFLVGVIERRSPAATGGFATALALGTFWLFDTLLRVPLPRGPFGF